MKLRAILFVVAVALVDAAAFAAPRDIPRTPSGKPDLSGNYELRFLTPFQRDAEHGTRMYMSSEEAKEVEEAAARRVLPEDVTINSNRDLPPAGGTGVRGNVGGYNQFIWFDRVTTTFAVEGKFRTSILTDPSHGRLPPLTETGKQWRQGMQRRYNHNPGGAWWLETGEDLYDHPEVQNLRMRCIYNTAATVPVRQTGSYNNVKTITQTDTHVVILIEWFHWPRIIRLGTKGRPPEHLPAEIHSFSGDSIGWWEGDTLVVDTTGFRRQGEAPVASDRRRGRRDPNFLREPGTPHEGLHVVERFTATDDGLFYEFTVEDPDYAAPYSGSLPWPRTDSKLYEYACHEGNYSMGNMLRGARLAEQEWFEANR